MLFIVVYLVDFAIGSILKYLYFKQESGMLYRTTYSMEQTRADLLIFGSSTANHNYDTEIFEKKLNLSCYNAGRDASSIFYSTAILKSVLKRHAPKIIILNLDVDQFSINELSYDRISSLLPYYESHPEIRSIIELKSSYEKLKLLSKIYPYNSYILSIVVGNTQFNKTRRSDINGYVPLLKTWNEPINHLKFEEVKLDSNKIHTFQSFIYDCIKAKVQLYIVRPPYFINSDYVSNSTILALKTANKYHIPFLDYYKDTSIISHSSLFADISHLNDQGARKFSNLVSDRIIAEQQK